MILNNSITTLGSLNHKELRQQKELYVLLSKENFSAHDYPIIWHELNHMKKELDVSATIEIKDQYHWFLKLNEVKILFRPYLQRFDQLNQLYIEIIMMRDLLDIPKDKSLAEVTALIKKQSLSAFKHAPNTLLEKLMSLQDFK